MYKIDINLKGLLPLTKFSKNRLPMVVGFFSLSYPQKHSS